MRRLPPSSRRAGLGGSRRVVVACPPRPARRAPTTNDARFFVFPGRAPRPPRAQAGGSEQLQLMVLDFRALYLLIEAFANHFDGNYHYPGGGETVDGQASSANVPAGTLPGGAPSSPDGGAAAALGGAPSNPDSPSRATAAPSPRKLQLLKYVSRRALLRHPPTPVCFPFLFSHVCPVCVCVKESKGRYPQRCSTQRGAMLVASLPF